MSINDNRFKTPTEYLKSLLKLPHVGSRGVDAQYQEVKNKVNNIMYTKLKSGLTD
jgi:hypothetical protein